jgi:hypothetical protein
VVRARAEVLGGVHGVDVRDRHHEVLREAGLVAARDERVVRAEHIEGRAVELVDAGLRVRDDVEDGRHCVRRVGELGDFGEARRDLEVEGAERREERVHGGAAALGDGEELERAPFEPRGDRGGHDEDRAVFLGAQPQQLLAREERRARLDVEEGVCVVELFVPVRRLDRAEARVAVHGGVSLGPRLGEARRHRGVVRAGVVEVVRLLVVLGGLLVLELHHDLRQGAARVVELGHDRLGLALDDGDVGAQVEVALALAAVPMGLGIRGSGEGWATAL